MVEQGSSVTYKVALLGNRPRTRSRHSTSACGPPAFRWCPREIILPPATISAPTAGLGLVQPNPFRASTRASRIKRSSIWFGVTRRRLALDFKIGNFSHVAKKDPPLVQICRTVDPEGICHCETK